MDTYQIALKILNRESIEGVSEAEREKAEFLIRIFQGRDKCNRCLGRGSYKKNGKMVFCSMCVGYFGRKRERELEEILSRGRKAYEKLLAEHGSLERLKELGLVKEVDEKKFENDKMSYIKKIVNQVD